MPYTHREEEVERETKRKERLARYRKIRLLFAVASLLIIVGSLMMLAGGR